MTVLLRNHNGAICWGELEQGIYELVSSKYPSVGQSDSANSPTDVAEEKADEGSIQGVRLLIAR
jgi:hypothetical protein